MDAKKYESCPRCGSMNLEVESHPATGVLIECIKCGACSGSYYWKRGDVLLQRVGKHRKQVTEHYERAAQAAKQGEVRP